MTSYEDTGAYILASSQKKPKNNYCLIDLKIGRRVCGEVILIGSKLASNKFV